MELISNIMFEIKKVVSGPLYKLIKEGERGKGKANRIQQ